MRNFHVSFVYQHRDSWDYGYGETDVKCEAMTCKTLEKVRAEVRRQFKSEMVVILGWNEMEADLDPMRVIDASSLPQPEKVQ